MPPRDHDVRAFHERAPGYEGGWLGGMHRQIVKRTIDIALEQLLEPKRILDIGCGTGLLLRELATRLPDAVELVGVDPAAGMIDIAERSAPADGRLRFLTGTAERLPLPADAFDLVVSTTSFDHWADQAGGLVECARVMAPGAHLVLTDQFSLWLLPTRLLRRHRHRARTRRRAAQLISDAGLVDLTWHDVYALIIRAAVAAKVEN
ncbi:MAG: class I SAM-dependent methyltransferase [Acidimicrobiales bacterium]